MGPWASREQVSSVTDELVGPGDLAQVGLAPELHPQVARGETVPEALVDRGLGGEEGAHRLAAGA